VEGTGPPLGADSLHTMLTNRHRRMRNESEPIRRQKPEDWPPKSAGGTKTLHLGQSHKTFLRLLRFFAAKLIREFAKSRRRHSLKG